MSKFVKNLITAELKQRYDGVTDACVVDLTGLNVKETQRLRASLREKSSRMEVVKNRLARRAFVDGPLAPLGDVLVGPCALVTTSESIIDVAKLLVEATQEFASLTLKQALVEDVDGVLAVSDVAKMRSRAETLADLAMLIASPGRAIAGCVGSPQAKIAGCLKAIVDKAA